MHTLTLGQTMSGKTYLNRMIAQKLAAAGHSVVVLDPMADNWPGKVFTDPLQFNAYCKTRTDLSIFIDESGDTLGDAKTAKALSWLATRGRHHGDQVYFIGQRLVQVPPTMRTQTGHLYLFNSGRKDAAELADEWNADELAQAGQLAAGEFYSLTRLKDLGKYKIDFANKDIQPMPDVQQTA